MMKLVNNGAKLAITPHIDYHEVRMAANFVRFTTREVNLSYKHGEGLVNLPLDLVIYDFSREGGIIIDVVATDETGGQFYGSFTMDELMAR